MVLVSAGPPLLSMALSFRDGSGTTTFSSTVRPLNSCVPCREVEVDDPFVLAGQELSSRLILGTGGAPSLDALERAIRVSGTAMCTVAMRRVDTTTPGSVMDVLDRTGVRVLPNT